MVRQIAVENYDPNWVEKYTRAAQRLKSVFGAELTAIYHIGSTAIPGIMAKPIIDILIAVRDIELVDALNPALQQLGYEACGEFGIPGRRYFRRGGDERTHHVHVFQQGNAHISRHLAFRDYLCAHPEDALAYSDLKVRLAAAHRDDIHAYMEGKHAFIQAIDHKAAQWRQQVGDAHR